MFIKTQRGKFMNLWRTTISTESKNEQSTNPPLERTAEKHTWVCACFPALSWLNPLCRTAFMPLTLPPRHPWVFKIFRFVALRQAIPSTSPVSTHHRSEYKELVS